MASLRTPPTNEEFAERVGCDFTTVSRWRNGNRLPKPEMLGVIAEAFGLPQSEMFEHYTAGASEFGKYLRRQVFQEL